ncbi:cytochrome c oxidase assembly protein [Roseomonas sp. SSH11]|uniref:Cytochrome c oxidase assembly protein n=1 Tax=Pararoseomonas baculiformis TaxID=2820812 RepID=A0ABS4AKK8_9PROT|nr:cytochrome c oxidase assembly protein [Pararoseomonas baculiformis]MBP0447558.1 cytochrome c oxidase assembly protein [Pararoseomonas baculiformis]
MPGAVRWTFDPALLTVLAALAAGGVFAARRGRGDLRLVLAGWALLSLALVSPLCHLSVALFSARVAQHLVIALVAAPLFALGLPRGRAGGLLPASLAFAVVLWAWHLPAPYATTFEGHLAYAAMQASIVSTSIWLWAAFLGAAAARPDAAALAGIATAAHTGLLGALLTLSPRPLFSAHAGTTWPWGLSPLEDQQLGGLLMWVPGGLLFAGVMVLALALPLRRLASGPSIPPSRIETCRRRMR